MDGDNSSSPAAARMLLVGTDPTAKRDVLAKLHALCGQKAPVTTAPAVVPVQLLFLSTKYYTAKVGVHVHQVLENEPVAALKHEPEEYEAVVCVVDVAREESFLHVSRFLADLPAAQIDVCLVVGVNSQSEKTSTAAQHIERLEAWCLDNEYEFVDICEDADAVPVGSKNQLESEYETNEKRGMDRVLEALHCNLWSSMVMRSESHAIEDNGLRELSNVSVALSTPSSVDDSEQKKIPVALSSNQTADAAHEEDAEEEDDDRLQTLLRALEITEAADKDSDGSASNANNNKTSSNQQHDDDEDNIDMAEFSALISEVRRVRDDGQALTDEQRRQRAAEVAMKLWSFLGEDDESDAEEEANK